MNAARACPVLLALGLLVGCVTNPSTGRSQLILVSSDEVTTMGEQATPQVLAEFGGEVDSPELRAYVEGVGRRLAANVEPAYAGIEWRFYVLDSDVVNAFALPGGKVFVTRDLLSRFDNEAQVAAVLGHEMGHITARHVDERISQAVVAGLGFSWLGSATESSLITLGAQLATQGVMLRFGRDQEAESDHQGLKYMTAAGYDPRGLMQVLEVLRDAGRGGRAPEFLSTHPYPETRLRTIARTIERRYRHTQGNPAYGLYPDRFAESAAGQLR